MKFLFIHQNFPAQFVHLAAELARHPDNTVVALTVDRRPTPDGVLVRPYTMLRPAAPDIHPMLRVPEHQLLHAEACAAAALQLKREGFVPDVILAHSGWGEALFMKDVFPQARLVIYCEYYYAAEGQDVGFDPELPPVTFAQRCELRMRNGASLLSLEIADAAISPTQWQRNTYPAWARDKIRVIHDGIDTSKLAFRPGAQVQVPGHTFRPGDEVLTYVARNLEPGRGFHVFMRTLPEVLRRRPGAHAVVVGADGRGYGHAAPDGATWRQHMLAELGGELDRARVHFIGQVSRDAYLDLLSVSRVHAYWTTPFVLSWSFLEAALSGVPVVASRTPPVLEFASLPGVETVDFFDTGAYAAALCRHLAQPSRRPAATTAGALEARDCVAAQSALLAGRAGVA